MEHIEKMEELLSKLYGDSHENALHIAILNREGGEMRDEQKKMSVALDELKITSAKSNVNLDWLLKFFWIIATASVGSLVAAVLGLILKK